MENAINDLISFVAAQLAKKRTMMAAGNAAMVTAYSQSLRLATRMRKDMAKATPKKKSNLRKTTKT